MLLSRTLIKKKSSSNSIENPLHISIHFYSKYLKKKMRVVLQVKSPSCSWCFDFVFPLPPSVTDGGTARCSLKKNHEIPIPPRVDPDTNG